jgi:hypothetical protein
MTGKYWHACPYCFLCFADENQYRIPHLEKEHIDRKVKPAELIITHSEQCAE